MNIKHYAVALAALALASCTSDDVADRTDASAILAPQFTLPTSVADTDTKAANTTLPVGLYIYEDDEVGNTLLVANRKYTTADGGKTWSSDEEVLYWDDLGDAVAVKASTT